LAATATWLMLAWMGAAQPGADAGSGTVAPAPRPNHLINEKSPYLRQHAYNPVDWYPWGEEAFAKARRENKPIFLSVGYSTCHWCHVMARESFENESIARLMNESFVSIKVDREERPDLDQVYLSFVEATTGGGGWPMTVFLTPDLKPFFGGSYFPPEDKQGRPGLRSILVRMAAAWKSDPAGIAADSGRIVAELRKRAESGSAGEKWDDHALDEAYGEIEEGFDSKSGGFGGAPKFPRPAIISFLFEVYAADPDSARGQHAREMALFTLRRMAEGGIHDQIGGGFHRYAVDGAWHLPHFEKMLYDQALLAESYLAAYQLTHDAVFAETARDILNYVKRDMTLPGGGVGSAEDADSLVSRDSAEHAEGAFYVWTKAEIEAALGPGRAGLFEYRYGVEPAGNVAEDAKGELAGENVLIQRHSTAEAARHSGLGEVDAGRALGECGALLYAARNERPRPRLDDKVLTSWNGLMISAFAEGYQVLGDAGYLESGRRAAAFIEGTLQHGDEGGLVHSFCRGKADAPGFGDDYAFLVQGLLDLYEASFDVHWLEWARQLQKQQDRLFWDTARGGYFRTTGTDATVLVRMKDGQDGAEPSVNSVAALNLLRLSYLFDDDSARAQGEKTIHAFAGQIRRAPSSFSRMLVGVDWLRNAPKQIVIEGRTGAPDTLALLAELNSHFIPRKVVILADGGPGQKYFGDQLEFFRTIGSSSAGAARAYVCQNYSCRLPTTDVVQFAQLLSTSK
jgi:uncharacterized protein